jgi:SAM-dependent methyltransferase
MSADLRTWSRTTFAAYQHRAARPRHDWWAWCGAMPCPTLDVGCGLYPMPGTVGVDLAFGDVVADATRLPFTDGSFAGAVTSHLIEHVDPVALLRELRRALRPGGRLCIEAPNLCGPARALRAWRAGIRDGRYPCGGATLAGALASSLWAYRHLGRVAPRAPWLAAPYPGKDPDAVWWCNSLAVARLLWCYGFRLRRAEGWLGHTFRMEAICEG